jgi:hypothetical protein
LIIPIVTQNVLNNLKPTSLGPLPDLIFKTLNGLPVDAATNLKNLGIPPRDVQAILGHAHISTTLQIYQHADITGKLEALQKYERQITEINASNRQIKPSEAGNAPQNNTNNSGAPGWIRTTDLRLRSPLLYPAELPGHVWSFICGFLAGAPDQAGPLIWLSWYTISLPLVGMLLPLHWYSILSSSAIIISTGNESAFIL